MLFQGQILNYPNINLQTVKDKQAQLKITLLPVFIYLFIYLSHKLSTEHYSSGSNILSLIFNIS